MMKKLTISINEQVYMALYRVIGEGKISQFIENSIKPKLIHEGLESAYQEMALDIKREKEAFDWADLFAVSLNL